MVETNQESVRVIVRCRPMSKTETSNGHTSIISCDEKTNTITISAPPDCPKDDPKTFTFDQTFGTNSIQDDVYQKTAYPIVESVLNGYNGTVFAYGQTGSGKTHTMMGNLQEKSNYGILPRTIQHIFDYISQRGGTGIRYLVRASFYELYNEELRDLLSPNTNKKLEIKENQSGVYVKDGSSFVVQNADELFKLAHEGNARRAVAATAMNSVSSRSHSIFSITVEMAEPDPIEKDKELIRMGKLYLVDLAGSERQSKTQATGDRLKEAAKINLSLSCLGNVISALVDGKSSHIPYRDSKLTRLLQDSLGGNSKTLMIAALSPASYNYDETLSTLRYASRTKLIKNKPKINEDPKSSTKDALLRQYQDEIAKLKEQLEQMEADGNQGEAGGGDIHQYTDAQLNDYESNLKQQQSNLMASSTVEGEEKDRLLQELQRKSEELKAERAERQALAEKLAQMEGKLLSGGGVQHKELFEKAQKQAQELTKKTEELKEQVRKEELLKRELEEREDQYFQMKTSFASLQEESNDKTVKLKKLWNVTMRVKGEIRDMQDEIKRERDDLVRTVKDLMVELKRKSMIVSAYIPQSYLHWMEANAQYDEMDGEWKIPREHLAGNVIKNRRQDLRRRVGRFSQSKADLVDKLMGEDETFLYPDFLLTYSTYTDDPKINLPINNGDNIIQKPSLAQSKVVKEIELTPAPRGLVQKAKHFA